MEETTIQMYCSCQYDAEEERDILFDKYQEVEIKTTPRGGKGIYIFSVAKKYPFW